MPLPFLGHEQGVRIAYESGQRGARDALLRRADKLGAESARPALPGRSLWMPKPRLSVWNGVWR
jgi:hypothetical protein